MGKYFSDHDRVFNTGNTLHVAAAFTAGASVRADEEVVFLRRQVLRQAIVLWVSIIATYI
jgi:hypothetical protein